MRPRTAFTTLACSLAVVLAAAGPLAVPSAAAAVPAAPAPAVTGAEPDGFLVVSTYDDGCLSGAGRQHEPVRTGPCDVTWTLHGSYDGYVVTHDGTGNCLSVSPLRIDPPVADTAVCGYAPPFWQVRHHDDGTVAFRAPDARAEGRCLTAAGLDDRVRLLPCGQSPGRHWRLVVG